MKELVQFCNFDELWADMVRSSPSERMKDDAKEQAFWAQRIARTGGYRPDPSSRMVVKKLLPIWEEYGIKTAAEIGPGWGNYTLDLAKFCTQLDCVDISRDILDYILKIGSEEGCCNIRTIHSKWEDFTPEQSYDMVFGYNCFYRQPSLHDCFARMSRAARKLCMVGMNNGLAPAWVREAENHGAVCMYDRKDYIYFVNVLYQMGYQPQLMVFPFRKPLVYSSEETLLRGELPGCLEQGFPREDASRILQKYFSRQPDGTFTASRQIHCALVWWDPNIRNDMRCQGDGFLDTLPAAE